jgi:hypothetical protein
MPHHIMSEASPQEIKDFIQRETTAMSAGTLDVMDQGWDKILEFMSELVHGLEHSSPEDHAMLGKILKIHRRLKLREMINDPALFRKTLRQATSSHPHSRNLMEASMIKIIELDGESPIHKKVADVLAADEERERELYTVAALRVDPPVLYFFERHIDNHCSSTSASQMLQEDNCPCCLEGYSKVVDVYTPPCGHHLCKSCAQSWLKGSSGNTFSCMQCRRCLICTGNDCTTHPLPVKDAKLQPVPLHDLLNLRFNDAGLHGIPSKAYWELRELTRSHRQLLAEFNDELRKYKPLGPLEKDAGYEHLVWLKECTIGAVLEVADDIVALQV